jgi:hypothetical protein
MILSSSDSSQEPPQEPLSAVLVEAGDALVRAADCVFLAQDGIPPANDVAQLVYVRQQAISVASVAQDVHLLLKHQRYQNVVGLCRIGFESRIHLFAAMRIPDFAAQKYLAQTKGNVDQLEELINDGVKSPDIQQELVNQKRLLDQMRQDFGGIKERKWKICEAAEAAGLKPDYEAHYSQLSKAAHNTPTGLASKDDNRILATSVLRLLLDTTEACGCLVFFREKDDQQAHPITRNWKSLIKPMETLRKEYRDLAVRLDERLRDEFRA